MPSFRMLPHGAYSLIPPVLTTMAWILSLFQDGCDYARLEGELVAAIASSPNTPYLEVGFAAYREPSYNAATDEWNVIYTGTCLVYPESYVEVDTFWKVAKGFAFAALVLGGGGTIFLWFSTCCVFSPGTWRWAGYEVFLAAIFQSISFLWFKNALCTKGGGVNPDIQTTGKNDCSLFWGSQADIVSAVMFFVAAIAVFCKYPAPKETSGRDGLVVDDPQTTRPVATLVESGDLNLRSSSSSPTVTTAAEASSMNTGSDVTADGQVSGEDSQQESRRKEKEMTEARIV